MIMPTIEDRTRRRKLLRTMVAEGRTGAEVANALGIKEQEAEALVQEERKEAPRRQRLIDLAKTITRTGEDEPDPRRDAAEPELTAFLGELCRHVDGTVTWVDGNGVLQIQIEIGRPDAAKQILARLAALLASDPSA
jgi:hypothetical protein